MTLSGFSLPLGGATFQRVDSSWPLSLQEAGLDRQLLTLRKEHSFFRSEKAMAMKEQDSTPPEKRREERESTTPAGA